MLKEENSNIPIRFIVNCILFCYDDFKLEIYLVSENDGEEWLFLNYEIDYNKTLDETVNIMLSDGGNLFDFYFEQLVTKTDFDNGLNEPSISTTYYAFVTKEDCDSRLIKNNRGRWFQIQNLPALKVGRFEFIQKALNQLKIQGMISPIVFELLPEKFTLKQVHKFYEQISQRELDKRNFTKKILSFDFIVKLNEKDKSTSTKGAYLYRFDINKFTSNESFLLKV